MDKQDKILERNKLIANSPFSNPMMRVSIEIDNAAGYDDNYIYSSLEYHSNWDWIMPVCKNLNDMYQHDSEFMIDELNTLVTLYDIDLVYDQLIKCIIWHYSKQIEL